jgi:hypothetical protein
MIQGQGLTSKTSGTLTAIMKSYVISGLTASQTKILQEAGVTFFPFDEARQSYLFENDLNRTLKLLGASAREEPNPPFNDVVELVLTFPTVEQKPHSSERQTSRRLYIKACGERIREQVEGARTLLKKYVAGLPDLQDQVLNLVRQDYFADNQSAKEQHEAEFTAEFERLQSVAHVIRVHAKGSLILVKTDTLLAKHPKTGRCHEIGEFLILINLNGKGKPVRWFNGTRRINGVRPSMNAPTVYADGTPTIDEIHETLNELLARLELSVVVELAIQFIEEIKSDSIGAHLDKWPYASNEQDSLRR